MPVGSALSLTAAHAGADASELSPDSSLSSSASEPVLAEHIHRQRRLCRGGTRSGRQVRPLGLRLQERSFECRFEHFVADDGRYSQPRQPWRRLQSRAASHTLLPAPPIDPLCVQYDDIAGSTAAGQPQDVHVDHLAECWAEGRAAPKSSRDYENPRSSCSSAACMVREDFFMVRTVTKTQNKGTSRGERLSRTRR